MTKKKAYLEFENQKTELDVLEGSEGEEALDIRNLRDRTGLVTWDVGFANTASTQSAITFIDGEAGILRYRGYPIEELAEKATFLEISYLLIYGHLPTTSEIKHFESLVTVNSMLHEDMRRIIDAYPITVHPMAILSAMACSLSTFFPETIDIHDRTEMDLTIARMMAKIPTIVAWTARKLWGQPYAYPQYHLKYAENLLHMMFSSPAEPYQVDPDAARALDLMFILHADHEQNCSTSTVRLVGSAETNLYASIASGVCALWGPLHGGANSAVVEMLEKIHASGEPVEKCIDRAKDRESGFRLMGFGHRIYKNFDPRAKIIKAAADRLLGKRHVHDPLLDIAMHLEEVALRDEYFIERKLYPNVDFYSGIIYRTLGIPTNMFTVMFALGRLPGWIAHWKEMLETPGRRIGRPRQVYTGATKRFYVPIDERGG